MSKQNKSLEILNFLAHAYLSFGDPDILIGNMIADLVKGKQIENYPETIRHGIHVHRHIDNFTDSHPVILETKQLLSPSAGRYNGSFLDVAYDHFLALDQQHVPEEGWQKFADSCYNQIEQHADILPSQFCSMFLYMKNENWFYNYRHRWMIERSFERLQRRANYLDNDAPVFNDFERHYQEIKDSYFAFFPELKEYVRSEFFK